MFCQRCGVALADVATACPGCNIPIAEVRPTPTSAAVSETVKAASRDALATFKTLAGNPVGGLAGAYGSLGEARSLRAGIAFGVVSLVGFLLGGFLMLPPFMKQDLFEFLGFGGVMKCFLFAVVPFLGTMIGGLAVRKILGGQGTTGGDAFIAGAALLPATLCMVLGGLLGFGNLEVIAVLTVSAGCIGVLMLYSGYTRISKLTERAGSAAVPIVVMLTAWLAKVLSASVLSGSGPSGGPYNYPF